MAKKTVGLRDHYDSYEAFQKRSLLKNRKEVEMDVSDEQVSGGANDVKSGKIELPEEMWNENFKFKCFKDDSNSFEIEQIMLIDGMDDLYLERLFAEVEHDEDALSEVNDMHLEQLFAEVEQEPDPFGEQHINPDDLAEEILERTHNKLYEIFIKPGLQLPQTPINQHLSTPTKRKRSPGQQVGSPSLRPRLDLSRDFNRPRALSMAAAVMPKTRRKRRTISIETADSNKITHHFKPASSEKGANDKKR